MSFPVLINSRFPLFFFGMEQYSGQAFDSASGGFPDSLLKIPVGFEDAVIADDCFDVLGLSFDFLLDLFHVWMFTAAPLDALDFAGGFLNVSKRQPIFGGSDMKGVFQA